VDWTESNFAKKRIY